MLHIILYQPEKPANTGNIMRTCRAINATLHIIGPLSFTLDDKSLKRAGMDYLEGLSLHLYSSYEDFISHNPHADIYYITRYGQINYATQDFSHIEHNYYVMFGRESTGIPHDLLKSHYDRCLRIPMVASARSLNLANCVALVAYEVMRQQHFYGLSTQEVIKGSSFLFEKKSK